MIYFLVPQRGLQEPLEVPRLAVFLERLEASCTDNGRVPLQVVSTELYQERVKKAGLRRANG